MYAAIGGCRNAFSRIKTTSVHSKGFVLSRWIPSEEGVPPWNEMNVDENAAEKIAEVRYEEEKLRIKQIHTREASAKAGASRCRKWTPREEARLKELLDAKTSID